MKSLGRILTYKQFQLCLTICYSGLQQAPSSCSHSSHMTPSRTCMLTCTRNIRLGFWWRYLCSPHSSWGGISSAWCKLQGTSIWAISILFCAMGGSHAWLIRLQPSSASSISSLSFCPTGGAACGLIAKKTNLNCPRRQAASMHRLTCQPPSSVFFTWCSYRCWTLYWKMIIIRARAHRWWMESWWLTAIA